MCFSIRKSISLVHVRFLSITFPFFSRKSLGTVLKYPCKIRFFSLKNWHKFPSNELPLLCFVNFKTLSRSRSDILTFFPRYETSLCVSLFGFSAALRYWVVLERGPVFRFLPLISGFGPLCLLCLCLLRCDLWLVWYSHWLHWWLTFSGLVLITVSFTRASVVNSAMPRLFSTTFPLSVSPWSFFLCLSMFHLFTNVFLQTTQETAVLGCESLTCLSCNFACLFKIFFVEYFLWQTLQERSMGLACTDFSHLSLCLQIKLNSGFVVTQTTSKCGVIDIFSFLMYSFLVSPEIAHCCRKINARIFSRSHVTVETFSFGMCWPYVVGQFHFASKCFITLGAWRLFLIVDALVMIIQRIFRHELLSTNVANKVSSHFSEICCVLMFLRRPAGMNWHFCFHLKGCWRPEKFFTKWEPNSSSCHPFIMVKNRQGAVLRVVGLLCKGDLSTLIIAILG